MPRPRTQCGNQLRQLGALVQLDMLQRGGAPDEGGVRYFMRLLADAGEDAETLICPRDPHAVVGHVLRVGDGSQDPATAPVFRAMCSYMVRDFVRHPVAADETDAMIAADACDHGMHHRGGINVLFADGAVRFLDRESLGLAPDEAIVVGPESPHPELKKLCIVPE